MEVIKLKIIVSNRTREHMKVHGNDFFTDWEELLHQCEQKGQFDHIRGLFVKMVMSFDQPIGISTVVPTTAQDEIVYAKRKNRTVYTRFVKNRLPQIINSVVVLLNQNRQNKEEYYLITLFPGEGSEKEPEDKNINSLEELKTCFEFWDHHAIIYDESILEPETLTLECPYHNLLMTV